MTRARDTANISNIAATDSEVASAISDKVSSADVTEIVALTQAAYDALTPSATTLYVVTD